MKQHTKLYLGFMVLAFLVGACQRDEASPDIPLSVQIRINEQSNPAGCLNKVYRYTWQERAVYLFINGYCADAYTDLYNTAGQLLCHPSGGFSGQGDGECPDFLEEATDKELVWTP